MEGRGGGGGDGGQNVSLLVCDGLEQGSLEPVIQSCLSWLDIALWALLSPILLGVIGCVPSPEDEVIHAEPLGTAPRRCSLPFPVALAELRAPQTLTTEYCS